MFLHAMSTISRPISREAVAAGDGTFRTCSIFTGLHKLEIIDQSSIAPESLGANPGAAGDQIFAAYGRDQSLQGANEGWL